MKILLYVFLQFGFIFANGLPVFKSDIKSFAYDENRQILATFDTSNNLNITDLKNNKQIKNQNFNSISSLAFYDNFLYAGLEDGRVIKFDNNYMPENKLFDTSKLKIFDKISHLNIINNKIYAVSGNKNIIVFDIVNKTLMIINLPNVYTISTFDIVNNKLIVTSWDRSIFEINLQNYTQKELFKSKDRIVSSAYIKQTDDILFGLANGYILSLKNRDYKKISDNEITAIMSDKNVIFFGTNNGELYKSKIDFSILNKNFMFSDRIIKFIYNRSSIIVILWNGEFKPIAN